jgi:hypothetical protein
MVRMKHEKHGFTHAENVNQEKYLMELGWTREEEKKEDSPKEEHSKEEVQKKRGRPIK